MRKYPFVKQEEEKDCGAASLAMIIRYYKGFMSLDRIREMTYTNKNGTNAYYLVEAANQIGLNAECFKCSFEDLNDKNIVLPLIVNVVVDNKYKHFMVIYKIDFTKKQLLVADPAAGIKKMTFNNFKNIFNGYIIILYPVKKIPIISNDKINYKYFLNILKQQKKIIKNIIALSLTISFLSIISSFYIEYLIYGINGTASYFTFFKIFLVFFLVYIFKNIGEYLRSKVLIIVNEKLDLILTLDTYNNILSLPYFYYRNKTTGDIISRMNDLSSIKDMLSRFIILIIVDVPLTLISLLFLIFLNRILFIFSLFILFLYLVVIFIFHKILEHFIIKIKNNRANITHFMVESISGFETVKGLKIKRYIALKFEKLYISLLELTRKFQDVYYVEEMIKNLIGDIGFVVITFVGAIFVLNGTITLGTLFTFNALIVYFFEPIKNVLSMDINIKEASCSLKRIVELNLKEKEPEITDDSLKGDIIFKDLTYSFDNDKNVLNNVNLNIKNGSKTMVIGPSGSGKSTLFKLLAKYYHINRGKISIGLRDINDINHSSKIKYINQIETLFTDTLYNNLTLGQSVSKEKIEEISSMCFLDKIVNKDQLGYNQLIEENGFNLSGGERQRIVLARTLLTDFDILIIDEGLNQIDIDLERNILKKIINKYQDKTIIVITHRLNNKDLYDQVVKFNRGICYE